MSIRKDDNGNVLQMARLGPAQSITIDAVSVQSDPFVSLGVVAVRLLADTTCHIAIGANPTALTTDTTLAAGVPEYFLVLKGEKLAVIGTSGLLSVTEVS